MSRVFNMRISENIDEIMRKHSHKFDSESEFVRQAIIQYDQNAYLREIVREEITNALSQKGRLDSEIKEDETTNVEYEPLSFEELDDV